MKKTNPMRVITTILVWVACLAVIGFMIFFMIMESAKKPVEQNKIYHVGILAGLNVFDDTINGFKAQMSELGYTENKNIVYDVEKFETYNPAMYETALKKFVDENVDLIFAFPTEAALAAKAATQNTGMPVVFAHSFTDGVDLVDNLSQPGGNITGVRLDGVEIATISFDIMRKIVPQVKRIWVPYLKDFPAVSGQVAALREKASVADITLMEMPSANASDLEAALTENALLPQNGEDVFLLLADPLTTAEGVLPLIYKFSAEHKMPIGGLAIVAKDNNAIFGLNPERTIVGKQAAAIANRLLKGARAGIIPVVNSKNYLQINLLAADKFGLKIGEDVISSADQVIR